MEKKVAEKIAEILEIEIQKALVPIGIALKIASTLGSGRLEIETRLKERGLIHK